MVLNISLCLILIVIRKLIRFFNKALHGINLRLQLDVFLHILFRFLMLFCIVNILPAELTVGINNARCYIHE